MSDLILKTDVYENAAEFLLEKVTQQGATSAEVNVAASKGVSLTVREKILESLEYHQSRGLTLTVYIGHKQGTATSTDLSKDSLEMLVQKALFIAEQGEPDSFAGLADKADLALSHPDLQLYYPYEFDVPEMTEQLLVAEAQGFAQDKRIQQSEGVSFDSVAGYSLYANTNGFLGAARGSEHHFSASFLAAQNGQMERDYAYTVARDPKELLSFNDISIDAAQSTVSRLGARTLTTRRCPVVFSSRMARGLWSSLINGISGGNLYRETSFLCNHLGRQILPAFIDVYQQPYLLKGLGSASCDLEGVRTVDRHFVKNGVLESYVLGSYSARKLGLKTTGNSGGVFNLRVSHSDLDFEALLKKMDTGLLVTELMGQGVHLVTGDYSRGAFGYWVEGGKIQYPVHEITLGGNLKEMFQQIVAIADDAENDSNIQSGSMLIEAMTVGGQSV